MGANVILFVMGNLTLKSTKEGKSLPDESLYKYEALDVLFPGIQANEAPVEYLIRAGADSGKPVTDLIYLCSRECLTPSIPCDCIREVLSGAATQERAISTEQFFLSRIARFCSENNCTTPASTAISFNPARPADSLNDLVAALGLGANISIDTTSGPRDAAVLLVLAMQVIKMGAKGTTIGDILYSNYAEKTIYKQNNSYDLIELVHAVDSFTDYGRADRLKAYFHGNPFIKEPTRRLCKCIEDFSDSLALCQIEDIEDKVLNVQRCLDDAEFQLGTLKERYALYTDAIEQIDSSLPIRKRSFHEAIDEIQILHPDADFLSMEKGDLLCTLNRLRESTTIIRSELLFIALIPAIREKFIRPSESRRELIVETIKWCNEHQMIQQALGIFREHIPQCVLDDGFVVAKIEGKKPEEWLKALSNAGSLEAADHVAIELIDKDIIDYFKSQGLCLVSKCDFLQLREAFLLKNPGRYAKLDHLGVDCRRNRQLSVILVWFRYVWLIRNFTMHVTEPNESFLEFAALYKSMYGEKECADHYHLLGIQRDLRRAIASLDSSSEGLYDDAVWEGLISDIGGRVNTIAVDTLSEYVDKWSERASRGMPYVFEIDLPQVDGVSKNDFMGAVTINCSDFETVPCIKVINTPANQLLRTMCETAPKPSVSKGDSPWDVLKHEVVLISVKMGRDHVTWEELDKVAALPSKASFGLGKNTERSKILKKLAEAFPSDFSLTPCLKFIGQHNGGAHKGQRSAKAQHPKLQNKNDSAKPKPKKMKPKKGSSRNHVRKPLGAGLSDFMDAETLAKLRAMGS